MPVTVAPVVVLSGSLVAGVHNFGPVTPPAGVTVIQAAIDRTNLALLTQPIDWSLELSIDAGATWRPWGGATMQAGTITSGTGITGTDIPVVLTESNFEVGIPAANANTMLRGSVITRETVTTTVTVRMS